MLRAAGPRSINRRIIVLSLDHQVCFLMNKYLREAKRSAIFLDCLQSTFSLKIRLVLISSSAIVNHDVIITIRELRPDEKRRTADSFVVKKNPPSAQKWSNRLVNCTAVDRLLTGLW